MEIIIEKPRERMLRRALNKRGYTLRKSRKRSGCNYYDEGGYMIVDPYIDGCIAGPRYELTLDDVAKYLDRKSVV